MKDEAVKKNKTWEILIPAWNMQDKDEPTFEGSEEEKKKKRVCGGRGKGSGHSTQEPMI